MAKTHQSKLTISDNWQQSNPDGLSTPADSKTLNITTSFVDGNANNQAQDMFRGQFTLNSAEEHAYDLAGGVQDAFGDTLTFATIKQILLDNRSTTNGDKLILGGGPITTGGALISSILLGGGDAGIYVFPSGQFLWVAPLTGAPVTGGSADILRIYNAGTGPITYNLVIKGTR